MERTRGWAKATLILSAALALCSAVSAQVLKGVQPGSNAKAITNNDVVQMVKEGTPEATIIATIRANPARFDVSLDKMLALQRQGISTHVLNLMAIVEMRRRKGASGRSGTNADELSPQPYPPKGILLTPGAQQSMLGTQANSPSGDGSKSALVPVVQQPAATDGAKQGATAMSPTAVERNGSLGDASVQASASGMPAVQTGTLNGGSGKTAVAANRAAVTAPAMMPKTSPGLMGTSQTMSAQGNASSSAATTQPARTAALAPQPAIASSTPRTTNLTAIEGMPSQVNLQVAAECAKDPTRRVLGVFDGSVAVKTFKIGHAYTIVGCSFGGMQLPGDDVALEQDGLFTFSLIIFQVRSWNDNSIVFLTDSDEGTDLSSYMNDIHQTYLGPMPLWIFINSVPIANLDGYGISVN